MTLQNGAMMTFYTRTVDVPQFPDRLQVRMSTSGTSTNVGTTAYDVGDFTVLMLDINPNLTTVGYPNVWTQFTVTVNGVASPTTGRLALRYFVPDGGFEFFKRRLHRDRPGFVLLHHSNSDAAADSVPRTAAARRLIHGCAGCEQCLLCVPPLVFPRLFHGRG